MNEYATHALPLASVFVPIIYQHIARLAVEILLAGAAGDHLQRRKVLLSPAQLLAYRFFESRNTRQDDRFEPKFAYALHQLIRIRKLLYLEEKVWALADHLPKFRILFCRVGVMWKLAADPHRLGIKVGENAIAIQKYPHVVLQEAFIGYEGSNGLAS
jgi:hypothetical protein